MGRQDLRWRWRAVGVGERGEELGEGLGASLAGASAST